MSSWSLLAHLASAVDRLELICCVGAPDGPILELECVSLGDRSVFASYNAGGGNVAKWIKAYGDSSSSNVDPIDWVERIPFSETRNYVQRVIEAMLIYRSRLDGPGTTGGAQEAAFSVANPVP